MNTQNSRKKNSPCPHFPCCSGCFDATLIRQEAADFFAAHASIPFHFHAGNPFGWRCRAKLAVRGTPTQPIVGLYEKGSHHAFDIPFCYVHHPLINEAAAAVRAWIVAQAIVPYHEETGQGILRYVQFSVDRIHQRVQLVLVVNQQELSAAFRQSVASLWAAYPKLWHSLWWNANTRRDNVIFGSSWNLLHGDPWLWEHYGAIRVCTHPAGFMQANPEMFVRLLEHLKEAVPLGSSVVEFYAGGGAIGLSVTDRCRRLVCNEVVPLAQECFDETYRHLAAGEREKISFLLGPAEKSTHLLEDDTDLVIVDPPRKGLDPGLLERINAAPGVRRLVYVSCGWTSFKRDCQSFLKAGWTVTEAHGFLFFPGTDHLEVLAVFDR